MCLLIIIRQSLCIHFIYLKVGFLHLTLVMKLFGSESTGADLSASAVSGLASVVNGTATANTTATANATVSVLRRLSESAGLSLRPGDLAVAGAGSGAGTGMGTGEGLLSLYLAGSILGLANGLGSGLVCWLGGDANGSLWKSGPSMV